MNAMTNEGTEWMNRQMQCGPAAEEEKEEEESVVVRKEAQTHTAAVNITVSACRLGGINWDVHM